MCINRFPIHACSSALSPSLSVSISIPSFSYTSLFIFSSQTPTMAHITLHHITHSTNDIKRNYTHTHARAHIEMIHQLNKLNFCQKFMRVSRFVSLEPKFSFSKFPSRDVRTQPYAPHDINSNQKHQTSKSTLKRKEKKSYDFTLLANGTRIHLHIGCLFVCLCGVRQKRTRKRVKEQIGKTIKRVSER